jgi:hypothetical protein
MEKRNESTPGQEGKRPAKVRVHVKDDGRIMAACPESAADVNFWVWCQVCDQRSKCFDIPIPRILEAEVS